jgi:hypothetical protein
MAGRVLATYFFPCKGKLAMNLVKRGKLANRNDYDIVISSKCANHLGLALRRLCFSGLLADFTVLCIFLPCIHLQLRLILWPRVRAYSSHTQVNYIIIKVLVWTRAGIVFVAVDLRCNIFRWKLPWSSVSQISTRTPSSIITIDSEYNGVPPPSRQPLCILYVFQRTSDTIYFSNPLLNFFTGIWFQF